LPETALLATWSVLLFGVIAAKKFRGGGILAIGIALSFLTLGLRGLPDLIAGLLIILLPLLSHSWRDRQYLLTVLRGLLLAAAVICISLVYLWASSDFNGWLQWHGISRFSPLRSPASAFSELPWFAWPLWPLAIGGLWHVHRRFARTPELHVPLLAMGVLLVAALVPAWSRDGALMPVFLPLALLAAYGLDNLRRGAGVVLVWRLVFRLYCYCLLGLFRRHRMGLPDKACASPGTSCSKLPPRFSPSGIDRNRGCRHLGMAHCYPVVSTRK
jgi:hypothetical protein